ncbi:MAG: type II toxin-antitoxin system prevent-host-death family antitoxin [Microthrixaceae bacterium]
MRSVSTQAEVGTSALRAGLSRYLCNVADGIVITVTHRGRPVARLVAVDAPDGRITELIANGAVRPARTRVRHVPERIAASGTVSDLVAEQRR